jgi:hypothetical protein
MKSVLLILSATLFTACVTNRTEQMRSAHEQALRTGICEVHHTAMRKRGNGMNCTVIAGSPTDLATRMSLFPHTGRFSDMS